MAAYGPTLDVPPRSRPAGLAESSVTEEIRRRETRRSRYRSLAGRGFSRAHAAPRRIRALLLENARLIHTAAKQAREFAAGLRRFP